jgi:hypothetical protein
VLTKVDDELDNLETGDPLLPPDANATSTLEVVPVHDNVNKQIDINDNPLDSSQTDKLSVAQKGGGTMVVGMKEGQGLLLEEQEDGIEKLEVLGQIVELSSLSAGQHFKPRDQEITYIVQDDEGLGPSTLVVTNGEEEAVSVERRQKLLNEESE